MFGVESGRRHERAAAAADHGELGEAEQQRRKSRPCPRGVAIQAVRKAADRDGLFRPMAAPEPRRGEDAFLAGLEVDLLAVGVLDSDASWRGDEVERAPDR